MLKIFRLLIFFGTFVFFSTDCKQSSSSEPKLTFATATALTSGTIHDLFGVYFVDQNTGFVVGDSGTILKTINGGNTWTNVSFSTPHTLSGVYFFNPDTGYVCGNKLVLKTTNAGSSWIKVDSLNGFTSMHFVDNQNGIASIIVQSFNSVIPDVNKTTNGGSSWQGISPDLGSRGVVCLGVTTSFFSSSNGFLALYVPASYIAAAYRTTNSGSSWDSVYYTARGITDIYCASSTDVYMCGDSGLIVKSTNFGTSWQTQTSGITSELNTIFFPTTSLGYIVGVSGKILTTANGGSTWSSLTSGTTNGLNSLYFPSATIGYIVGYGGTILKISPSS